MEEQTGCKIQTDTDMSLEIGRKILAGGASERSISRQYGIGHQGPSKI